MQPPPESEGASPRRRGRGPSWVAIGVISLGACLLVCLGGGTSVLYPAFLKFQATVQDRACQAKLRTISSAISLYATDFDDRLPPAPHWMDTVVKYLPSDARILSRGRSPNRIFKCPAVPAQPSGKYGYAMWAKLGGRKRSSLGELSTLPIVFDSEDLTHNAVVSTPDPPPKGRHSGKNNFLFLDGHVKALAPEDRPWQKTP